MLAAVITMHDMGMALIVGGIAASVGLWFTAIHLSMRAQ